MKIIVLAMPLLLLSICSYAENLKHYNVCTITLNSKDEIEVFKKNLPTEKFEFIELTGIANNKATPEQKKSSYWPMDPWFKQVCEAQTTCDILIISSHQWEGKFFGESGLNPFRLTANYLRDLKYNNSCSSFFANLKQVYLFGCNTLTKEDGDYASFEAYVKYLAYDSHSSNLEAQLPQAHTQFSRAQPSNDFTIRSIFSDVKGIYGFSKRSPEGKFLVAPLQKFFKEMGPQGFEKSIEQDSNDMGLKLIKIMSPFSMTKVSGFTKDNKNEVSRAEFLFKMQNPAPFEVKLEALKKRILEATKIQDMKIILEFIWPMDKIKMSDEKIQQIEFLTDNQKVFDIFVATIEKSKALGEKLDAIYIGQYFGLFDSDAVRQLQKHVLIPYLKPDIKFIEKEIICNVMTFQRDLSLLPEDILQANEDSSNYKEAIRCLRLNNNSQKRVISSNTKKSSKLKLHLKK